MRIFGKKKENKNKESANVNLLRMAFQEALRELEQERKITESLRKDLKIMDKQDLKKQLDETIKTDKRKIEQLKKERDDYKNNLETLQATIENVRKLCKDKNGRVISSLTILKELGE